MIEKSLIPSYMPIFEKRNAAPILGFEAAF